MFERFTDQARRVVVLAQEESRRLGHDYIGSEHVLLALVHEGDAVAAQALRTHGVTREACLADIAQRVQRGDGSPAHHIPFTRNAKKTLDISLREALTLGHDYIGTEHILLGLLAIDCTGRRVLIGVGTDTDALRESVIRIASATGPGRTLAAVETDEHVRHLGVVCSLCGRRRGEVGVLVAGRAGGHICEHCIRAAADLLDQPSDHSDDHDETGLRKLPPPDQPD
jgi:ATP-dependent Clp protease ATP-binding subunit ClpC